MEARGTPNGDQNEEFREHFATASQEPSRGGFGEDSGWIWGGFWDGFGRIWEPRGAQMDMKTDTCRGKSRSCPQDPPREALGTVLGGFGRVRGRFWEGFGRTLSGILANPCES